MCGDKWANIFCQILYQKPRVSCLHWKPMVWLSQVGLMSGRNGREQTCVCVSAPCLLFVCVLYCGTTVVRPLNTSGHGGVWPGVDRGHGTDGSVSHGLVRQTNPDSGQRASGGTCAAGSCINPPTLFAVRLSLVFFSPLQTFSRLIFVLGEKVIRLGNLAHVLSNIK